MHFLSRVELAVIEKQKIFVLIIIMILATLLSLGIKLAKHAISKALKNSF